MLLSDFDYELPNEIIARYPTKKRRASRLLNVGTANSDAMFAELPSLLRAGDLLVLNNTRVMRARLHGRKETGGRVEVLVERVHSKFDAMAQIRASKTPKSSSAIHFADHCQATVIDRVDNMFLLRFSEPVQAYLDSHGEIPLPPYLGRQEESSDTERYQTVYAESTGAVAAPTAGLHFDHEMLAETKSLGVAHAFITLHVGAGTFQPLRHERAELNRLHAEHVEVSAEVCALIRETRASGGRVIAVGTTSVRALEAASAGGQIDQFVGDTDIFILPGYEFQAVDMLLTNFHLPKSSLLMLVAAFGGYERIMSAYRHAVQQRYRFFSYGDAMLISPESS